MLVIPPILDEITIKKKLQQLKADYLRKNAVVIRKKLLLSALNKGMRYRGGPESQTHKTEIRSTKRTQLDIQQEKSFREFEAARRELLQDLTPGQSPQSLINIENESRLSNYFSNNLPLLYRLFADRNEIRREWAIHCFENPCKMNQISFMENDETNQTLTSLPRLTRKYPYYVWHLAKKYHSIAQLEAAYDQEEKEQTSLYSSQYLQSAWTAVEQ